MLGPTPDFYGGDGSCTDATQTVDENDDEIDDETVDESSDDETVTTTEETRVAEGDVEGSRQAAPRTEVDDVKRQCREHHPHEALRQCNVPECLRSQCFGQRPALPGCGSKLGTAFTVRFRRPCHLGDPALPDCR